MNNLPMLLMNQTQAAAFREETLGDQNQLEPRLIEAGPYKGQWALPERVIYDPAHEARRDALRMLLPSKVVDADVAWPPTEAFA